MRTYDEIIADAKERVPFSNGFEGESWMENWCWRPCKKDRNSDCPLILASFVGFTPKEWAEVEPRSLANRYHCSEFEPEDEPGGEAQPEPFPQPVAEMDGQTDIFSAFADQVIERAAPSLAVAR